MINLAPGQLTHSPLDDWDKSKADREIPLDDRCHCTSYKVNALSAGEVENEDDVEEIGFDLGH